VSEDRYVVYRGGKPRAPENPVRIVRADGTAFHVIREDALRPDLDELPRLPLADAITEAFRRADRTLPPT
jgi:hypothetical protein